MIVNSKIRENFIGVLKSAHECYYNEGLSNDKCMIILEAFENDSSKTLSEFINIESTVLNEASDNLKITDVKVVKEKYGYGLSLRLNGTEYRYVSDQYDTHTLYYKFMKMLSYANAGYKALNWLKKVSIQYYGGVRFNKDKKKELTGD